jgi:Asp-tRNA(Asn)/Glu-tRNA(Gln) amidotransferase A subunit family amidase
VRAELHELTATEAARLIAEGSLTSQSLVRACLERIEAREPYVQAWTFLDPELVLAQAKVRDAMIAVGPLHGVPVGVKDTFDTYDMPTEYGSPLYAGHRPRRDAAALALARGDGAVVIGKTVTTEFGFFAPGKTRNPHDRSRTPGGSSSGSAAAVADRMVPVAFGAQTAGSIIRPAAFCGVVGLKPSFGRISRSGMWPFAGSLDTVGTIGRTVADAALLAASGSQRASMRGAESAQPPPRIGMYKTHDWERAAPESRAAVEDAARILDQAGARLSDVPLSDSFGALVQAHSLVMAYEASHTFAHELREDRDSLSTELVTLLDQGLATSPDEYDSALRERDAAIPQVARMLEEVDVLLTPSVIGEAPLGLGSTGDPDFNRAWTFLGAPAVHLPAFTGPNDMPVGVQLVGPVGGDERLLTAAIWAEQQLSPR